jgi:hypothetical protein
MNIAIVNTFSYRPHNEHLVYLKKLLCTQKTNNVYIVSCGGGFKCCNTLISKKRITNKLTCKICKEFGIESFSETQSQLMPIQINKIETLTEQLRKAVSPIAKRRLKAVKSEFMAFNNNHIETKWANINSHSKKKILFLPSSRMEHLSEFERKEDDWEHPLDGITYLIETQKIRREDLIIRFHPIWAKLIFGKDAMNCIEYYKTYCTANNICYVSQDSNILTASLIEEADIVILNGGSAFFEASIIGKPIISLSRSFYDTSEYQTNIFSKLDANNFQIQDNSIKNKTEYIRKALRFLYCFQYRYHQFTEDVYHLTAKDVFFKISSKGLRNIQNIIEKGEINAYDNEYDYSNIGENEFIEELILNTLKWQDFVSESIDLSKFYKMKRKSLIKELIASKL